MPQNNALATQVFTAKPSATQGTGTSFWPASGSFATDVVEDPSSFSVHYIDAGNGTATVDVTVESSMDGVNWQTDSNVAFTQVTTVAKRYCKTIHGSIWGKYIRVKMVVAAATSGANSIFFVYKGQAGAFTV